MGRNHTIVNITWQLKRWSVGMTMHRSNMKYIPEIYEEYRRHAIKMPHLTVTDDYIHAWTTYRAATTPVDSADERFEKSFQWPPAGRHGSIDELYKTQKDSPYDAITFAVLFGRLAKRFPQRVKKFRCLNRNWWKIFEPKEVLSNAG